MKILVNAGHTIQGLGYGAVGLLKESEETRKIANALVVNLRRKGHFVNHCTVNKSANYLRDVCTNANSIGADLFVSIHLNASNGQGKGSEVYTWNAEKNNTICDELSKLGFKNRGVKKGNHLYVIKNTKMKAILIEVCFLDNKEDVELYKKLGVEKIAQAIAKGIVGEINECTCTCKCDKCKKE